MFNVSWALGASQHLFLFIFIKKKIHIRFSPVVSSYFFHIPQGRLPSIITLCFSDTICFLALITNSIPFSGSIIFLLKSSSTYISLGGVLSNLSFQLFPIRSKVHTDKMHFCKIWSDKWNVFKYQGGADTLGCRKRSSGYRNSDINILILIFLIHIHRLRK